MCKHSPIIMNLAVTHTGTREAQHPLMLILDKQSPILDSLRKSIQVRESDREPRSVT